MNMLLLILLLGINVSISAAQSFQNQFSFLMPELAASVVPIHATPSIEQPHVGSIGHGNYGRAPRGRFSRRSYRPVAPRMMQIYCANRACVKPIIDYQYYGRGKVSHCYLDRIAAPEFVSARQYVPFKYISSLDCLSCGRVIGYPIIYKESGRRRKAYYMIKGNFVVEK
jgi:hypothetical protein